MFNSLTRVVRQQKRKKDSNAAMDIAETTRLLNRYNSMNIYQELQRNEGWNNFIYIGNGILSSLVIWPMFINMN